MKIPHPAITSFAAFATNKLAANTRRISFRRCITSCFLRVQLRDATVGDVATLEKWENEEHVVACGDNDSYSEDSDEDWDWNYEISRDPTLSWRQQLIAEISNGECKQTPIGVIQIIDPKTEESRYWGEDCEPNLRAIDIWIGGSQYLNQGYGTEMMMLALRDYCFNDDTVDNVHGIDETEAPVQAVLVDPLVSNKEAIRFYQSKCGFDPVEERLFGSDRCLVHSLNRTKWESMDWFG